MFMCYSLLKRIGYSLADSPCEYTSYLRNKMDGDNVAVFVSFPLLALTLSLPEQMYCSFQFENMYAEKTRHQLLFDVFN